MNLEVSAVGDLAGLLDGHDKRANLKGMLTAAKQGLKSGLNFTANKAGEMPEKAVQFLTARPELESKVRTMLSYRLLDPRNRANNVRVGQLIGSGAGGLSGGLAGAVTGLPGSYADEKNFSALQDHAAGGALGALVGAATGALGGRAAGRHGPRLLQKSVGRVLTNVMDPHNYDPLIHKSQLKDTWAEHGPVGIAKAIWNDKPLIDLSETPGRAGLFRDFSGMPLRDGSKTFFNQLGRTADNGKLLTHNLDDVAAMKEINQVAKDRVATLLPDIGSPPRPGRQMEAGKRNLQTSESMANFHVQPDGKWEDVWDFSLHPGEKIDSVERLLRAMVTPLGTPSKVVGKTLSEADTLRAFKKKNIGDIHESFTGPILNRATRGTGIPAANLEKQIRENSSEFLEQAALRTERKPYNLLHALAAANDVKPGDLRVMLGAPFRAKDLRPDRPPFKFNERNLVEMFTKRLPGTSAPAVQDAIATMAPRDRALLDSSLREWVAAGRPQGGELAALSKATGFEPGDLMQLLQ